MIDEVTLWECGGGGGGGGGGHRGGGRVVVVVVVVAVVATAVVGVSDGAGGGDGGAGSNRKHLAEGSTGKPHSLSLANLREVVSARRLANGSAFAICPSYLASIFRLKGLCVFLLLSCYG